MNDEELQEALVGRLRLLSRDEPDLTPDVRAAQRARLVAMAAVRPVGAAAVRPVGAAAVQPVGAAAGATRSPEVRPSPWRRLLAARAVDAPLPRWRTRLTAGLAGAAMTVGALSGLTALAQGAEPGDLLYGLKRGSEETRVALASADDRGLTLLGLASVRLSELADLTGSDTGALPVSVAGAGPDGLAVAASGVDAGTVVEVLRTMDDQTTEGTSSLTSNAVQATDAGAFDQLLDWTEGQRSGLTALDVPAGADDALAAAVALVDEVAARAGALQATLQCPAGSAPAGTDRLGPLPGECLTAAPTPSSSVAPSTDPGAPPATGTGAGQAPATTAPGSTTAAPSVGGTGGGGTGGGAGGGGAGTGGGAAPSTTAAIPTVVPGLPTTVPPTTVPPLIDLPLPLPSTTICVGGLICVGG